jgi:holliday junction DNA helicase RuvB
MLWTRNKNKEESSGLSPRIVYRAGWEDWVGHEREVKLLLEAKEAARERAEMLRPILLWGPSGCGKTTLARLVAEDYYEVNGATLEPVELVMAILHKTRTGGTILIDEIHGLSRAAQEVLFSILDDGVVHWAGEVAKVTVSIMGATTDLSKLVTPLRNRFTLTVYIGPYSVDEMAQIARNMAKKMQVEVVDDAGIELVAQYARQTPRVAMGILERVRDLALPLNVDVAIQALGDLGYDESGLTAEERAFILSLYALGGKASLASIASRMQQDPASIKGVEGWLLASGFITISGGRVLTIKGIRYAQDQSP